MSNSDKTNEKAARAIYRQRVNGLGRCLLLWASQYYDPDDSWSDTEEDVVRLNLLLDEMHDYAYQIDRESMLFWRQIILVLSKAP